MVGLFHLGNKASPARSSRSTDTVRPSTPPPPYGHERPVFSTTTTTHTVTTTTHTTTHFFSLPLWRRRTQQATPFHGASPERTVTPTDELGVLGSPSTTNPVVLMRDKDLPPTPPLDHGSLRTASHDTPEDSVPSSRASVEGRPSSSSVNLASSSQGSRTPQLPHPANASQSTAALARAVLGLGLPPLMLTPTPSTSSEVNSVTFAVPSAPSGLPSTERASSSTMRRTKSFHKDLDGTAQVSYAEVRERRRNRGLSLGTLLTSSEEKGKEREVEGKSLSRKGSFWNRKRNETRAPMPVVLPSPTTLLQPSSLPALQPMSPFRVEGMGQIAGPSRSGELGIPDGAHLRRRHSERSPSSVSKSSPPLTESSLDSSNPDQAPRRRRPIRPQTADSPSSPRANSSYFPSPAPVTASPAPLSASSSEKYGASPVVATSLRPRSQTNPPLLHRLSMNLFGSSPAPSPVAQSVTTEGYTRSPSTSFSSSISRQSPKVSMEVPRPRYHEEESPEIYLHRLMEAVSKAEVASVLASSADEFHTRALKVYLAQFDFAHDPLDVALRRLLMDVGLPRETQQIDRVMEAFAMRYRECHPNLFISDDHPYILAFSLIMLHTDAFNKSNKRKMTKADYLKNTRLPGIAPEVLDCFYDNIVFAPFIFIEDPLDVNGQRGLLPEGSVTRRLSTLNGSPGGANTSGGTLLGKNNKIDPYYLITKNLLDDLRVNIRPYIPLTSPYFYQGNGGPWDDEKLLRAFAMASIVEVASESRYVAPPWFGLNVGGGPTTVAMATMPTYTLPVEVTSLKVTKVGLLLRKDDVNEGGRKSSSRKWKEWSVLLTGSQLLFSRDPTWATLVQSRAHAGNGVMALQHGSMPRPDEMYSVKDAVAVYDRSYTKYDNTLRLVMPDGRHLLLQTKDALEMNDWIACINYASAFKTAGVRMRSLGLSGKDLELTGQAAAVSHLRDISRPPSTPRIRTWDGRSHDDSSVDESLSGDPRQVTDITSTSESTPEEPITPPMDNASGLLKATFDQVKADLAAGKWQSFDASTIRSSHRPRAYSLDSTIQSPSSPSSSYKPSEDCYAFHVSSRSKIIRNKVRDLDNRISLQKIQLDADMRFVRNIAILTPFQRSTRERLQVAIQNVAKRIMHVRLDVEKLTCHRDVLVRDLAAEERDWQRTKKIALRAATQKLDIERKRSVPRMTLSMYVNDEGRQTSSPQPIPISSSPDLEHSRPGSTATGSFHSALDFTPPDSASRAELTDGHIQQSLSLDFSTNTSLTDSSISGAESPWVPTSRIQMSAENSGAVEDYSSTSHEQFYSASESPEEQAEEWNKTRAAKRVSLVRVPSTLRMSVFSGKHGRDIDQMLSEDSGATITVDRLRLTGSAASTADADPLDI